VELAIVVAAAFIVAVSVAAWNHAARRRYERLNMSGGRKALVRNLFGG